MNTSVNDKLKYLDCELYNVETDKNGNKQIHIDGYCYWNDESYQCVQGTFCYVSVNDLEALSDDEKLERLYRAFEETKQYQGEVTETEVNEYYEGAKELRMEFVTSETPDGLYVHY